MRVNQNHAARSAALVAGCSALALLAPPALADTAPPGPSSEGPEIPVTTIGSLLDVHVYDMSRVEALSGPQGTLYGASSLSGTLRLIDDAIEAEKVMQGTGGAHGLLRISASPTFGTRFIAPLLPAFRARHPRVKLHLSLNPFLADVGVGDGKVDVAVRIGQASSPGSGLRKLGEIAFWIVGCPTYLANRQPITGPADLVLHDLVGLYPRHLDDHFQMVSSRHKIGITWSPAVLIDDPEAVKRCVLAGGGLAALPSFVVSDDLAQGRLVRVLADWTGGAAAISLIYALRPTPPLRVRLFLEFLQEMLEPMLR